MNPERLAEIELNHALGIYMHMALASAEAMVRAAEVAIDNEQAIAAKAKALVQAITR